MQQSRFRTLFFQLHRYLGLLCGLLLVVIGTTGSLLVFSTELEHHLIQQRIGKVIPQGKPVDINQVFAT